jgi:hypothetical protein
MPQLVQSVADLQPGDLYEDSAYHPCLCVAIENMEVMGISLVDGSYPRADDIGASGVRKLTVEEAWQWRLHGPCDAEVSTENRWW